MSLRIWLSRARPSKQATVKQGERLVLGAEGPLTEEDARGHPQLVAARWRIRADRANIELPKRQEYD